MTAHRGRPFKPNRKLPYGTKLRPDQIEWLRAQGTRKAASILEAALDEYKELREMRNGRHPNSGFGK